MLSSAELRNLLRKIDHKGYPSYKELKGRYDFVSYVLSIDHVQGDPFASPSKVSIHVKGEKAGFPAEYYWKTCMRTALQDYVLRQFAHKIAKVSFQAKGSGKSGLMSVSRTGQEVLCRSACEIGEKTGDLVVRMEIGFPANGRTVNSGELMKIFFDFLPECVKASLFYSSLDQREVEQTVFLAEDQQYVRDQLPGMGLVAFVANGSILPRESGVSGKPMKGAVRFQSPESLEVSINLPHGGILKGMGIRKGITLIVGGGYHGKSTLLKALELGVYPHIAGDGREFVITDDTAVKLRAEDGRSIQDVDISMFIRNLPNGKDTKSFYTEDASGSTSQAANVVEAMEAGAKVFLIDEDTSATNFMIRDELMQCVVHGDDEPIIPFIDRIRELYDSYGISTILVAGSCGAYFHRADCVIQMNRYEPYEITEMAKKEAERFPIFSAAPEKAKKPCFQRIVRENRAWKQNDRIKIKTLGRDSISIDRDTIDLRYVEQIADSEQMNLLGQMMKYAMKNLFDGRKTLSEAADDLYRLLSEKGVGAVSEGGTVPCNLAFVRRQEIYACMNRWRGITVNDSCDIQRKGTNPERRHFQ